jgi:hypothetical protein
MIRPGDAGVEVVAPTGPASVQDASDDQTPHDFVPLLRPESRPVPASQSVSAEGEAADEQRLLGTLVHRLVHRYGFDVSAAPAPVMTCAHQLLRAEEASQVGDTSGVVQAATDYYLRLCSRADVRALYDARRAFFEVPFASFRAGRRTRGLIDCLLGSPAADDPSKLEHLTVVELKTGAPRPEHRDQVAAYRDAARSVFPGIAIDTVLVYPDHIERG